MSIFRKFRPLVLHVMAWPPVALLIDVNHLVTTSRLGLISAGVAFWAVLSFFPGLAALISLWGVIGDPAQAMIQLESFQAVLPADVYRLIVGQLNALIAADGLTLGWASAISFLFALWTARAGVSALIQGLNALHAVKNRSGVVHDALAIALTLALIGIVLIAMGAIVIIPVLLVFVPLGPLAEFGITIMRWSIGIAVLMIGFSLLYRFGPNQPGRRPSFFSLGTFVAVIVWMGVSTGFSFYLQNFGSYNEVYGSIGAVIALLMWLFLSAFVVLIGAAIDVAIAKREVTAKTTP